MTCRGTSCSRTACGKTVCSRTVCSRMTCRVTACSGTACVRTVCSRTAYTSLLPCLPTVPISSPAPVFSAHLLLGIASWSLSTLCPLEWVSPQPARAICGERALTSKTRLWPGRWLPQHWHSHSTPNARDLGGVEGQLWNSGNDFEFLNLIFCRGIPLLLGEFPAD